MKALRISIIVLAVFIAFTAIGDGSLGTAITVIARKRISTIATIVTGIMMAGYIAVKVKILKQVPPGSTFIEGVYFMLGSILIVLGVLLWRNKNSDNSL